MGLKPVTIIELVNNHTPMPFRDVVGDLRSDVPLPTRQWVCLFRTFKKTAPCEFIRCVRLQAGNKFGHSFCRIC